MALALAVVSAAAMGAVLISPVALAAFGQRAPLVLLLAGPFLLMAGAASAVAAVATGHIAHRQARQVTEARAALIIGYCVLGFLVVFLVVAVGTWLTIGPPSAVRH